MRSRFSLTVLGGAPPFPNLQRASAGYLISINKRPRILVDAGVGTYERLGRSGLDLSSLEQILFTHLHIDHTSDLPAVIMHLFIRERQRPIRIAGPTGGPGNDGAPANAAAQPGVREFVRLLFGPGGAWRSMKTFEDFGIESQEVPCDPASATAHPIGVGDELEDLGVSIRATAVPHGMMPAIAFRIDCDEQSIVFSGDVSRTTAALIALAKNCSMLVHDFAVADRDVAQGHLHANPSAVGVTAGQSGAEKLLLSLLMPATESELQRNLNIVRHEYGGKIEVANDLDTFVFN